MSVATEERRNESLTENTPVEIGRKNRAEFLDLLRGFAIIYVMLYHLMYDLIFFGGMDLPFFLGRGESKACFLASRVVSPSIDLFSLIIYNYNI